MELRFPLILDGATGTELQKYGLGGGDCPEAWILEHPDVIREIQRAYVEAGSDVIYAPTFGANRIKLEAQGYRHAVEDFNLRLAALSRGAAAGKALVAGDIAPTGHFLSPLGDVSFEELVETYTEQATALEKAGVDLFVIETMMTVAEARAAVGTHAERVGCGRGPADHAGNGDRRLWAELLCRPRGNGDSASPPA